MAHDELQDKLDLAAKALQGAHSPAPEMVAIRTAILHLIDAVQEVHKKLNADNAAIRSLIEAVHELSAGEQA